MNGKIELRPVGEDDLAMVHRLTSDPLATGEHEWFGWQDPRRYRRLWEEDGLLGPDSGMLIVASDGTAVGFVSWYQRRTARTSFCTVIGIALLPDARGRGYGTQAQRLLVRYLFAHTQVNRIEATTEISNLAEQRALEKAGFSREGVIRGAGFQGGRWHDGVMYSVLRSEVSG